MADNKGNFKRTVKKELFRKIGQDDQGRYTKSFVVSLVNYEGKYKNRDGELIPFSKDSIEVAVAKLDYKTGEVLHKAKEGNNGPYAVKDEQKITIEIEAFKDILFAATEIVEEI